MTLIYRMQLKLLYTIEIKTDTNVKIKRVQRNIC